jgi:hypothetical protein
VNLARRFTSQLTQTTDYHLKYFTAHIPATFVFAA